MLRFDANITQLYTDVPFLDRFAAAAADGFRGVEMRSPFEESKQALAERLAANDLELVLFNFPAGNWGKGSAASPACRGARRSFARASPPRSTTRWRWAARGSTALPG